MKRKFQCWFCGEAIDDMGGVDPCGIVLTSNIDKDEDKRVSQNVYCHIRCFKKVSKYQSFRTQFEKTEN